MLGLYADECANGLVIRALRQRRVDVMTAHDDGRDGEPDTAVMDRATELGRVLFSQDDDLLIEAVRRQRAGNVFSGVIFAHQHHVSIRDCIDDLELIATTCDAAEFQNRVVYLPL